MSIGDFNINRVEIKDRLGERLMVWSFLSLLGIVFVMVVVIAEVECNPIPIIQCWFCIVLESFEKLALSSWVDPHPWKI